MSDKFQFVVAMDKLIESCLRACPANPRSPFDTLRANGMGIEKIDIFPFVLSPSKPVVSEVEPHNKGFAGQAPK